MITLARHRLRELGGLRSDAVRRAVETTSEGVWVATSR